MRRQLRRRPAAAFTLAPPVAVTVVLLNNRVAEELWRWVCRGHGSRKRVWERYPA